MKKNGLLKKVLISAGIFLSGVVISIGTVYIYPDLFNETVTKLEKDVTITDEGISESVDKVYDSVVVVSTYKDGTLISSGSGFIYKKDETSAYIITNHHVIDNGNSYKVTYTDESTVESSLLGSDEYSDIAVLKVAAKDNYSEVQVGSSSTLKAGDTAFTVGTPLDNVYSWTVTRGIISSSNRLVEISTTNQSSTDYMMNVIQTDAAVNSGNSGGPLCNINGEVVGVISAKISSTGVEGMGFAIPIETAIEKSELIIKGEKIEYPYLGISMINLSDIAKYQNYYNYLPETSLSEGIVIASVEDNSSASKSGLASKDIITKIGDVNVNNIAYFKYELYKYKVGDTVTITYERNGKTNTVKIKLLSNKNNL